MKRGNAGVNFFCIRHNELLKRPVVLIKNMDDWNIEGSDVTGIRHFWKASTFADEFGEEKAALIPFIEYGGIEIKTIGPEQYLPRFGVNDLPCGTIGIPIWGRTQDLNNGWTNYTRETHGNLKRWMQPSVENRGSRPITIVHFLETRDVNIQTGQESNRYFAALAFEDVSGFLSRLTRYLKPFGLDISNWDSIPVGVEARNLKIDGLFLQGNMVHVPLSELADLLTVTMIGEEPTIFATGRCSVAVQIERLNSLKELSQGRWIPQVKPGYGVLSDEDIYRQWEKLHPHNSFRHISFMDKDGRQISP